MSENIRRRIGGSALLAGVLMTFALPAPATAAPAYDITLPAGTACGFELRITGAEDTRVVTETRDDDGTLVRVITAGKGPGLTFTNTSTGARIELAGNGSVSKQTVNADGSSIVVATGHNVLVLFPTDVPKGPSTTLYTGRVVYASTATNDFTILRVSGTTRDLCGELSSAG